MDLCCDIAYKTRAGSKVYLSILNETNAEDAKDFVFIGSNGFSYNKLGRLYSSTLSKYDIVDYFYKEDREKLKESEMTEQLDLEKGMGMKIQLGRSYISRGGDIISIVDTASEGSPYDFRANNGDLYFKDGCYLPGGPGHEKDIVGYYLETKGTEEMTAQTKEVLNKIEVSAKEQLLEKNQKFSQPYFIIKKVKNGYILTPTDSMQSNGLYKEVEEYVFSSSAELGEFIERKL